MTNCDVSREMAQCRFIEYLGYQTHTAADPYPLAISNSYASTLLTTML